MLLGRHKREYRGQKSYCEDDDEQSDPVQLRRIGNTVEGVLKGTVEFQQLMSRIVSSPPSASVKQPQISLNNEISESNTVLEILAEDCLGFAYSVAQCLAGLGLNIAFAKLSTEKTMVFDVFYLTGSAGEKLPEERWDEIIMTLEGALQVRV